MSGGEIYLHKPCSLCIYHWGHSSLSWLRVWLFWWFSLIGTHKYDCAYNLSFLVSAHIIRYNVTRHPMCYNVT